MVSNTNSKDYQLKLIHHLYSQLPSFTDVFDEETFYITVVLIVISSIVLVCIMSRFITIKAVE